MKMLTGNEDCRIVFMIDIKSASQKLQAKLRPNFILHFQRIKGISLSQMLQRYFDTTVDDNTLAG